MGCRLCPLLSGCARISSCGRSSATESGTCCGQAGRWKRCERAKRKTVPFCSLAPPHQGVSVCHALRATKPDKEGKLMRQRRWPVQHEGRTSPSDVKTSLAEPESPPSLRERAWQIEAEQVRLLYTQAPTGCVATVLNTGIVTFVLWKVVAHPLLIAWLALLIAIILSLFVLLWMYQRATPTADRIRLWRTLFVIGAGPARLEKQSAAYADQIRHPTVLPALLTEGEA